MFPRSPEVGWIPLNPLIRTMPPSSPCSCRLANLLIQSEGGGRVGAHQSYQSASYKRGIAWQGQRVCHPPSTSHNADAGPLQSFILAAMQNLRVAIGTVSSPHRLLFSSLLRSEYLRNLVGSTPSVPLRLFPRPSVYIDLQRVIRQLGKQFASAVLPLDRST